MRAARTRRRVRRRGRAMGPSWLDYHDCRSFCDERIELYLARELSAGAGTLDHDEVIAVSRVPFEETFAMIRRGDIVDAKTIVALYRARDFIELERRG